MNLQYYLSSILIHPYIHITTYQLHCYGGTLPQNFISKHVHVQSNAISVLEIKYRFYIYGIYFERLKTRFVWKIQVLYIYQCSAIHQNIIPPCYDTGTVE